jgi:hypothetical protein
MSQVSHDRLFGKSVATFSHVDPRVGEPLARPVQSRGMSEHYGYGTIDGRGGDGVEQPDSCRRLQHAGLRQRPRMGVPRTRILGMEIHPATPQGMAPNVFLIGLQRAVVIHVDHESWDR